MSSAIGVIPARFDSQRFPGKLLAGRTGKPLLQHTYERARRAELLSRLFVATDDERIRDAAATFGASVVMTRADHPNGTSRICEAIDALAERGELLGEHELIVNVQGDEPEIEPHLIDLAVQRMLDDPGCPVGTLASPFADDEDPSDPSIVKVVVDHRGRALYFSRAAIPFHRDRSSDAAASRLKHVGLYVYRRHFLATYPSLTSTPLERTEHLEQLRVLEHGHAITVAIGHAKYHGIDTPEQYDAYVARVVAGGS